MIASVYDMENNFICECKAAYSQEDATLSLSGDRSLMDKGPEFIVHYTDSSQGVMDLRCAFVGYEREENALIVTLKVNEIIKTTQRRQDLKMRTNLPVKLTLLDAGERIQTDPVTMRAVTVQATLRDISAGGVMIDSETELEVSQKMMFPFDKGSSPIMIQAEVIREQETIGLTHRYGCRFINNNSGKEAVIREYVFRLESSRRHTIN